jgi:flagellar protein FlbD
MIRVTRFSGKELVLNCELIRTVEATPDTVITLAGGEKLMVREAVDEVVRLATEFRKRLIQEKFAVEKPWT